MTIISRRIATPISGKSQLAHQRISALGDDDQFNHVAWVGADPTITNHNCFEVMPGSDTDSFVFDRAGIGIDVDLNHMLLVVPSVSFGHVLFDINSIQELQHADNFFLRVP